MAGALAASLAILAPSAARAGTPSLVGALTLGAWVPPRDERLALLVRDVPGEPGQAGDPGDGGGPMPLPGWVRRWLSGWGVGDGVGYTLRPRADARDGWFVGGDLEPPTWREPPPIEPLDEPDSPRRILGQDAHGWGVVLDLSEIPRLLVALGAGGGHHHLHAYLGWQLTVGR